ncbi:allophanate hydrolase [Asticcacaulis sp. EMRT-3]|uniref:allophanate hydrolase n=1 Tax=Asticcacaulis sp. EMRT-3 TaxID=3040349 RepID=UPI0024AEE3E9|nr:allophanate hydrolase [Asticcacaulis sp. EMRT-3]MDI7776658.1 allophanate hydrolase [Asticcacaulis sp. EMRT-3]
MTRWHIIRLAAEVRAGQRTAVEVASEVLQRLAAYDRVQPQAWISRPAPEDILAAAQVIDARIAAGEDLPLAGVPFAVKDNIDVAGMATTAACPDFSYVAEDHAHVVARVLAAGALYVGKTNLDQFATGLNGTRSPYGAPACVFNRAYISGGSSSGSSVAVGAGLVAFAFGTDTAGSGRVPAAFNHLTGFKPTKGRWSTSGLVPACRSLDCISVFTASPAEAALIDEVVAGFDASDVYSRPLQDQARPMRVIGVPRDDQLNGCGDAQSARLFAAAMERLIATGHEIVRLDISSLSRAAALLYQGPWVAERTAALGDRPLNRPETMDPTVRDIVLGGLGITAVEAFKGQYELAGFMRDAEAIWAQVDALMLPTAPTIYRIAEMQAAPIVLNAQLGLYTNFVNLLDMAAVAIPAGFRANGTGFGVTFMGPAWTDKALITIATTCEVAADFAVPPLDLDRETRMETVKLAVVGAHLKDMPLHWQLTSREAVFVTATETAPTYRLYAMTHTTPPKPALIHDAGGAAIQVEVYELDVAAFGSFVAEVPAPLAIGTVTLSDGSEVKGFVAEPRAMEGAQDITALGGWRAYIAARA